ncbi:ROK family transcriptional regulator [Caballeronia sp. LZ043]|uniref:ROK family protein n=1 Tax=Caballeronia sp. LZ043 TaxID=3038569 RepID=UPI00285A300F|nr:ROK family transcriptional regulator [Caballeronia sp. LZ043]MDR5826195.1 ROK family transcriptional regulator [Caballeronia sp. LZ043]
MSSSQPKSLRDALAKVAAGSKAARVREILPDIDRRIAAGARIADVVEALNDGGLDISIATLKSYLYRFRRAPNSEAKWSPSLSQMSDLSIEDANEPAAAADPSPATPMLLRHINTARCLRLLRRGATYSRAELARELGLTRATIGHAVRELLHSGLIVETANRVGEVGTGRPGLAIALNPAGAYAIGVDLSSIGLTAVILDLGMTVVHRLSEPVASSRRLDDIATQIYSLAENLLNDAKVDPALVQGLCVSVPGLVDRKGNVVVAPFLQWRDVPLRKALAERIRYRWPITIRNDAVAFATAERAISRNPDSDNMLLVLLKDGLGGAIVQNGQIFEGAHGYAVELGHMVMAQQPGSARSQSFETLAGFARFSTFLPQGMSADEGAQWLASQRVLSEELTAELQDWSDVLSTGLLNLTYLFDPERIVLGGPLCRLFTKIEARTKRTLASNLLHGFRPPTIEVTRFGSDGAAIGAAAIIREQLFELPQLEAASR